MSNFALVMMLSLISIGPELKFLIYTLALSAGNYNPIQVKFDYSESSMLLFKSLFLC